MKEIIKYLFVNMSAASDFKRNFLRLKWICLVLIMVTISININAQNFNYSFAKDSSSYSELSGATVLTTGVNFSNKSFVVHFPFNFNFCGTNSDSLKIETNGFLVFDKTKQLAIVAYNNYSSKKDTLGNYTSSISYNTSGATGNRIIKIEFKNLAQNTLSSSDFLSYQVWLYESGNKVEIHTGANASNGTPVLIGIINKNMDTSDKAYLIKGDTSSPSGEIISGEASLDYLNQMPNSGIVYTLSPAF